MLSHCYMFFIIIHLLFCLYFLLACQHFTVYFPLVNISLCLLPLSTYFVSFSIWYSSVADWQENSSYRNWRSATSVPSKHRKFVSHQMTNKIQDLVIVCALCSRSDPAEGDLRDGHWHRSGARAGHRRRTVWQAHFTNTWIIHFFFSPLTLPAITGQSDANIQSSFTAAVSCRV